MKELHSESEDQDLEFTQDVTGSNQYVGNWPGVTVEKKEGKLKGHKEGVIQDLPGIYSLSPYTLEEVVARSYLVGEKPDAILNIVDGTNIERNLYLTTQLIELGIPVVVAVNMIDLVRKSGDTIDLGRLGVSSSIPTSVRRKMEQRPIFVGGRCWISLVMASRLWRPLPSPHLPCTIPSSL